MILFYAPDSSFYVNAQLCDCLGFLHFFQRKLTLTLQKWGMFNFAPFASNKSSMSNPLSAITVSFLSKRSNIPLHLVISLSEMAPVYNDETKVTAPCGAIPIRPFKVVLLLYEEYNCDCSSNDDSVCTNSSQQSSITQVVGYRSLNPWGMCSSTISREAHIGCVPSAKYK